MHLFGTLTRHLVHYHAQFLGLSNLNEGIEDRANYNFVCAMSS